MKLKNKVFIGLTLTWVLFLILTYTGSNLFLTRSYLQLEQDHTNQDLNRIDQALNQQSDSLYTFTADWAHWNDLYDYVQGKNPAFISKNLTMTAFVNSTINLITIWDSNKHLLMGTAIDTDKKQLTPYPAGLEKYLYASAILVEHRPDQDLNGYILVDKGIMMVAAVAITDGEKSLPPRGMLVTGRNVSLQLIHVLANTTQLNLELLTPKQIAVSPKLAQIYQTILSQEVNHFSQPISAAQLEGFTLLLDIYHQPIGMFHFTAHRTIYLSGQKTIHYYLLAFLMLGIVFTVLLLHFLNTLIIKRLEHLDHEVADISQHQALSHRVDVSGNDELSSVSSQINTMIDIIQTSHEQLEHNVEERTQELHKANLQLQQEIAERLAVEKALLIHKENLARLAHYDHLTGLPNRLFFNEILNKAIHHASRHQTLLAILFIDLDRFKTINDAMGHPTGDLVLKEIAQRFSSILRADDILARLGGDEFVVLLNNIDANALANSVAEKLLAACAKPVTLPQREFYVSASMGICIYPHDGTSLEDLLRNADIAMYKAKQAGGAQFQYFTQKMDNEAHEYVRIESALRKAIVQNEFVLHYQPKLNLIEGKIRGVEALIRWHSPELGVVEPAKFIPIAEMTGLILPIGEWVLREACQAAQSWQNQGFEPVTVAVNLSAKQFKQQNISQLIATILAETGLNPHLLELEITETAVMDHIETAIDRLNEMNSMGITLALDDFGTGHTSMSYLKNLPVQVLKIDQSFIKGVPSHQNDNAIISSMISLAHSLGMKVVAEGVETIEQWQYLAGHGCDMIQGYYISRPVPERKIILQFTKAERTADSTTA